MVLYVSKRIFGADYENAFIFVLAVIFISFGIVMNKVPSESLLSARGMKGRASIGVGRKFFRGRDQ